MPGSLLMKDFHTASAIIQPVTLEARAVGFASLYHGVYLNNIIVPGIFMVRHSRETGI